MTGWFTMPIPFKRMIYATTRNITVSACACARSSDALKELLGTVELEPVSDKDSVYYALLNDGEREFKPYYAAHTKIQTASIITANIKTLPATDIPIYQQLSEKAARLKLLSMS